MNFSTSRRADNASNFVIISPPNFKVNNFVNCDDIQFKALIPRQGNHLIRDFSSILNNTTRNFNLK